MSDDAEGVQWNVATFKDKPERDRLGNKRQAQSDF